MQIIHIEKQLRCRNRSIIRSDTITCLYYYHITYTLTLSCTEGKASMSAGLAAATSGSSSGKRLASFTRWVWNSTDSMVATYLSGNWQTEACRNQFTAYSTETKPMLRPARNSREDTGKASLMWSAWLFHLQRVLVPAVVLEDQSDGGDVSCAEHRAQAARR